MNTATANLIILTAEVNGNNILGTAIDGDIKVLFAVTASEVNRRLFVPEANLVVTGKFRLGREVCSLGISIKSVVTVVSLPVAVASAVTAPSEAPAPIVVGVGVASAFAEPSPSERQVAPGAATPSEPTADIAPAKQRKTSTRSKKKVPATTAAISAAA